MCRSSLKFSHSTYVAYVNSFHPAYLVSTSIYHTSKKESARKVWPAAESNQPLQLAIDCVINRCTIQAYLMIELKDLNQKSK